MAVSGLEIAKVASLRRKGPSRFPPAPTLVSRSMSKSMWYKVVADISYTANATDATTEVGRPFKAVPPAGMVGKVG